MEKVKLNIEIEISVDDYNDMIEKIKLDNVGSNKKDIEDIDDISALEKILQH